MTKSCCKHRHGQSDVPAVKPSPPAAPPTGPSHSEPVMRRWPHPVTVEPSCRESELTALLHRQTELLLEIRALLAGLTAERDRRN